MKPAPRQIARLATVAGFAIAVALPWIAGAYTIALATSALVAAILALSAHVLQQAGLPSLGQAAFLGVGAYTAAHVARNWTHIAPAQLAISTLVGACAAAVAGLAVSRTRGAAFMIATLGVGELAYTAAERTTQLTGGGNGFTAPPTRVWFGGPLLAADGHKYFYALTVSTAITGVVWQLMRSRFGLVLRAIADHEPRTQANGHHTTAHLWVAYTIAGALAAAAGSMLIATRNYVAPSDLAFDVSATALIAAIIGRGRLSLTLIAATGIVAVRYAVGNMFVGYSPLLLGVTFVLMALAVSVSGQRRTWQRTIRGSRP